METITKTTAIVMISGLLMAVPACADEQVANGEPVPPNTLSTPPALVTAPATTRASAAANAATSAAVWRWGDVHRMDAQHCALRSTNRAMQRRNVFLLAESLRHVLIA